jgi:sugar lactone lactonase YvrE
MLLIAALGAAQQLTFTRYAGTPGVGSDDGPVATAQFNRPMSVAADAAGNLYIADFNNYTIRKLSTSGVVTTVAGRAGVSGTTDGRGGQALFNGPTGVAVDANGNLFVTEQGNGRLRKITPNGAVSTVTTGLSHPTGVVAASDGTLYVTDVGYQGVMKVVGSTVTALAGGSGIASLAEGTGSAARFNGPQGIAIDASGTLYVADYWNSRIRTVTPGGTTASLAAYISNVNGVALSGTTLFITAETNTIWSGPVSGSIGIIAGSSNFVGNGDGTGAAARFNSPRGITADGAGNAIVADVSNHILRRVTTAGAVTTIAGVKTVQGYLDGTGTAAQFKLPYGLAADANGNVFVADAGAYTVRKIAPGGIVTTLAGSPGLSGSADGSGSAARFYFPWDLACDAAGNVYVSDTSNYTIRKITPAGVVTTVAGLAGSFGSADGVGSAARFYGPEGLAFDSAGNLFVADNSNNTIRKIAPDGTVTTVAGVAGSTGTTDGTGNAARFNHPSEMAIDAADNLYVHDGYNYTIRKITPAGVVTTFITGTGNIYGMAYDAASSSILYTDRTYHVVRRCPTAGGGCSVAAGVSGVPGSNDGTGSAARFNNLFGVAISGGNVYVSDNQNCVRRGQPAIADAATVDAASGPVGVIRQLGTSPQTATSWSWALVRRPSGSSTDVSSATASNPTFTPDLMDVYTFRLTATGAAGASVTTVDFTGSCPAVNATITASGPTSFCTGGSVTLTAPAGNASYLWSNGATTQSITVSTSGSFSVTVTDANGCAGTSAPTAVTVNPIPAAITSPSQACADPVNSYVSFVPDVGSGATYAWTIANGTINGGADTRFLTWKASAAGFVTLNVTVTTAAGCTSSSSAQVTAYGVPDATITAPALVCTGGQGTASVPATAGATYSWNVTNGTIVSGAGTRQIIFAPTGSSAVSLSASVSSNGCNAGSSKSVNVAPLPNAAISVSNNVYNALPGAHAESLRPRPLGGTYTFCGTQTVRMTPLPVAGNTYLWSTGATTASITTTVSGTFSVTVTDPNGCSSTDSVTVNINPIPPAPTINASGPLSICPVGGSVTLTSSAADSYLWSTGATTQAITVTQAGGYTVTGTVNGCSRSSSVTVTYETAAIQQSSYFCSGPITLTASAGASSYLWSTGATTRAIDVTSNGTYSVTESFADGCANSSASANVTAFVAASIALDPSGCPGVPYQFSSTTNKAGLAYQWYLNGSPVNNATAATLSVPPETAGYVSLRVSDGICSSTSNQVSIPGRPIPPIQVGGPTTFCEGGSVALTAPYGKSVLWSDGSTMSVLTARVSGSYGVTVTDYSGCSFTTAPVAVTVFPSPKPVVTASGPLTFCSGGNVTLTAPSAASYSWSNGATTQSITVSAGGSYQVGVTYPNGCSPSLSDPVYVNAFVPHPSTITPSRPADNLCPGQSVTLTAEPGYQYLWSTGATTQSITVSAGGDYSVTTTDGSAPAGCQTATSAPFTVSVLNPTAAITPSGPTTFCRGGSVTLTANAGSSYLWSNNATTRSITVNFAGTFTVQVTEARGFCTATSAPVTVVVNDPSTPTITTSGPTQFCQGGSVTLTSSAGSSYLWSNGAATQSITVSAAGSYSVTATDANGCSATSAPATVVVNPLPSVSVTSSAGTSFCAGSSTQLTASTSPNVSLLWSTGATTSSIVVSAAGTYSVTTTDGNGCSNSASITITVNTPVKPAITAGGPVHFCPGGSVTLTSSPSSGYHWSSGETTQSIAVSPASSTGYRVTTTDGNGCSSTSDTITVFVDGMSKPSVTIFGSMPFCPNGGSVTLATSASPSDSFLWSNGATTQNLTVYAAGTYSITVTNSTGCSATSDPIVVTTYPSVSASVSGTTAICAGASADLSVSLTGVGPWTVRWTDGVDQTVSSSPAIRTVSPTSTTTYALLQVSDSHCAAALGNDRATVTVNALPTAGITAGGPTTFCAGGSVTLSASAASSYLWSTGATTQSITVNSSGSYSVTVTSASASGCSATSSSTAVTVNPLPTATITAGGPTTFCAGGSVTLTASSASSYLWSTGATTQSITVSASGNYSVTVTDANGCSATSSSTAVTVNPLPTATITAGGPTTFCAGGSVTLTASAASSYLWSTGATTQSITVGASGSYSVTVTNANGCSATSSSTAVTVNPLPTATITAGGPTTFCAGGSVTLTASAASSYLWSTGATTQSIAVSASGNYSVTVTNASGCQSASSAATTVTVNPLPTATITAGGPTTFCAGGSVTLTASAGSSYLWSTGATTQSITVGASGSYTVRVTNANGCQSASSAPTTVAVNPLPATPAITAGGATTFCQGGSVTLTSSAGSSYLWSTGATTQSITVGASGSYTVRVTNASGCQSASSAPTTVAVNQPPVITAQPQNITTRRATTFTLSGVATGTPTLTYQWYNAANGNAISGATGSSYSTSKANRGSYTYYVRIKNPCNTTGLQSNTVTVTVN